MTIQEILNNFHKENTINAEVVTSIRTDKALRESLINYFRQNRDREYALALLEEFMAIRKRPDGVMPAEELMLACYILGLHNNIDDLMKIWEAKNIDFDTYCGMDIQLTVFADVSETLDFLKQQTTAEANEAFEYITECYDSGDFADLDEYFSNKKYPWFL